jgi:pSer/pThr/pTyr-binding forkhead associated (FHA) protein
MAVLIGMSGDVKGKSFTLDANTLSIGRSADNTIPLNNATVSGHHCTIALDGERHVLRDLGSTNGTRVNAAEIKEAVLKPKDLIQVGAVEFLYNSDLLLPDDKEIAGSPTEVLVTQGPTTAPDSFDSISPFGARRKDTQKMWSAVLVIIGVLALAVVAFFFFKLVTAD